MAEVESNGDDTGVASAAKADKTETPGSDSEAHLCKACMGFMRV